MHVLMIRSFEGRNDVNCSVERLQEELQSLAVQLCTTPTLVNIYDGDDRIAIIGLGSSQSTLQCVDKGKGISSRAVAEARGGDDKEFAYQGEATFVASEFLVPVDMAIRAAAQWFADNVLISDLRWRSRPYPPQRGARDA